MEEFEQPVRELIKTTRLELPALKEIAYFNWMHGCYLTIEAPNMKTIQLGDPKEDPWDEAMEENLMAPSTLELLAQSLPSTEHITMAWLIRNPLDFFDDDLEEEPLNPITFPNLKSISVAMDNGWEDEDNTLFNAVLRGSKTVCHLDFVMGTGFNIPLTPSVTSLVIHLPNEIDFFDGDLDEEEQQMQTFRNLPNLEEIGFVLEDADEECIDAIFAMAVLLSKNG